MFDRSPGYDRSEGNRSTADLFYITKSPKNMNDDIIKSYGELDMTDPNVIYDFLVTANTYFPSKHTVLNIWSHGRGSDYASIAEYLKSNEFDKEVFTKFLVSSFYEFERTNGLRFSYCAVKTSEFDNDMNPKFWNFLTYECSSELKRTFTFGDNTKFCVVSDKDLFVKYFNIFSMYLFAKLFINQPHFNDTIELVRWEQITE